MSSEHFYIILGSANSLLGLLLDFIGPDDGFRNLYIFIHTLPNAHSKYAQQKGEPADQRHESVHGTWNGITHRTELSKAATHPPIPTPPMTSKTSHGRRCFRAATFTPLVSCPAMVSMSLLKISRLVCPWKSLPSRINCRLSRAFTMAADDDIPMVKMFSGLSDSGMMTVRQSRGKISGNDRWALIYDCLRQDAALLSTDHEAPMVSVRPHTSSSLYRLHSGTSWINTSQMAANGCATM